MSADPSANQVPLARFKSGPSARAIRVARIIAIVADALQLVLFPLFIEGFASVLSDALDVVVGITMIWLVGWHLAFLPAFVVEALPVGDLAPTWTLAVFIATRSKGLRPGTPPQQLDPPRRER